MLFKTVDLKKLLQMMQDHDVLEITLRDGKTAVEIKRNGKPGVIRANAQFDKQTEIAAEANMEQREIKTSSEIEAIKETEAPPPQEISEEKYYIVKAPLVGTFFRAPAPDADPFVEVGDKVQNGDVLCIVEAMKSMNEIYTDVDGVIREICVDNAELVEFEQPLFKIDTSG